MVAFAAYIVLSSLRGAFQKMALVVSSIVAIARLLTTSNASSLQVADNIGCKSQGLFCVKR